MKAFIGHYYTTIFGIPLALACGVNLVMAWCWWGKVARLMLARVMFIGNSAALFTSYLWLVHRMRGVSSSGWGLEGLVVYLSGIVIMLTLLVLFLLLGSWALRKVGKKRDTKGYAMVMDFLVVGVLLAVAFVVMKQLVGDD